MSLHIPENLIFPDSQLRLYFEEPSEVNRTRAAIIIEGTRSGFLSLANVLLFLQNDLEHSIPIHELSFVDARVRLVIKCDSEVGGRRYGHFEQGEEGHFAWVLNEDNLSLVASDIHSLGHLNPELHMDDGMADDEISAYCVVG